MFGGLSTAVRPGTKTSLRFLQQRALSRMASSAASSTAKQEWLVILPDRAGALQKRMEVRPKHLEGIVPKNKSGFWNLGGAMLEEQPKEGEPPKIVGSVMLASANSIEEVVEQLESDIYMKEQVWDKESIQIIPFRSAIRNGM